MRSPGTFAGGLAGIYESFLERSLGGSWEFARAFARGLRGARGNLENAHVTISKVLNPGTAGIAQAQGVKDMGLARFEVSMTLNK